MRRKLSGLGLILLFSLTVNAQYRTIVHSISRKEGLSNGAVNTIVKDAEGYMWFGTWNGLNRYDGNNIVTFLPGSSSNSIHNHVIRELHPTASGPIWMLTNKGLGLYDNVIDRFTSYFDRETDQINFENDISIAHSDSYGTLASLFGQGLFRFDSISGQFEKMVFDEPSLQSSLRIIRIHIAYNQPFSVTEEGKLLAMYGESLQEIMQLPLTGKLSSSISVKIDNQPCIIFTQRDGPALLVNLAERDVRQLTLDEDIITSFSYSGNPERLWAGTEKGSIYSFDLRSLRFEEFNLLSGLTPADPFNTRILTIHETEPGILWIGTDGNGIFTLNLEEFPNRAISADHLAYPIVRSILVTEAKNVLIGTKGGGIDVFDSRGKYIRNISVKDGLTNNSVLSFHQQSNGMIWVGTDGKGVDIVSADFSTIRNFPSDFIGVNQLQFGSVYRIFESDDGRIYLGTSGFGVIMTGLNNRGDSEPIAVEQLILDQSIPIAGQQNQIVYSLAEERPGTLLVGTRGLGVYRYNTITRRVETHYSTLSHPGIGNDDVLTLAIDNKGNAWIGTSNGLYTLSRDYQGSAIGSDRNTFSDLSSASIHSINPDKTGNIWVTTNQGLSLINAVSGNTKSFNVNDGLINYEYSDGASFYNLLTGELFVGGTMGVDIIQTRKIQFKSLFPPIGINELRIKNQPVKVSEGSVLNSRINHQSSLELKYNQNAFSFSVAPLAYWGKERYKISYRLLNYEDEWTAVIQNQSVSFLNIPSGEYTFQLRVSDENGNWSENIREIEITVLKPPWSTSWAIAGYIALFLGFQYLIFSSFRRKVSRKKEALLQEFKKKKEEELQSYKIEFFTNVAHEFRTPLTLISSHIHVLLEDTRNAPEQKRLLKVYKNSIKLQKMVLEIMQFRKLEKGKEPLNISTANPVELIREVVSDLELLAQQKSIVCEVMAIDEDLSFNTDVDKLQRIATNLISNSIKHNNPGGFVRVSVKVDRAGLHLTIEDNGVGISTELLHKVFEPFGISSVKNKDSFPGYRSTGLGLAVTKGLVELLRGKIDFESTPGEGTKFRCIFPDVHQVSDDAVLIESDYEYSDRELPEEGPDNRPFESGDSSSRKPMILMVDDDPEILALINEFLLRDYNIIFAKNGSEAYDRILSDLPDLVISDVMMPVMDGIELCSRIRSNFDTSHIPLILLTAKAEIEDRITGLKAGADSYIPKPFHPDHLKVRIEKLLGIRGAIRSHFGQKDADHAMVLDIPDPFFQKLLSFIDENIDDESLSSERLCDKLAISKSSLYNKTRSVLGTTPHSLINQRRLSKACTLLKSTAMTVSEIIDQTGFASRTHFYDLFNKAYGCSPSEYRSSGSSSQTTSQL